MSDAKVEARAAGRRVEVLSLDSEFNSTYAEPNGSLTTVAGVVSLRVRQGSQWVAADQTLVADGKGAHPRLNQAGVRIGGVKSLASFTLGGAPFGLGSESPLPAVALSGATARFLGAGPGGAAVTVTAANDGVVFDEDIATRPAATLPAWRVPLMLSSGQSAVLAGNKVLIEVAGKPVGWISAPIAHDAQTDGAGQPSNTDVMTETLDTSTGTPTLVVTPDQSWLQAPSTQFPVVIDPSAATIGDADDTYISQGAPTTSYGPAAGLNVGGHMGGANRTLLKFDLSSYGDTNHVLNATLNLTMNDASDCADGVGDDGKTIKDTAYVFEANHAWNGTMDWNDDGTGHGTAGSAITGGTQDATFTKMYNGGSYCSAHPEYSSVNLDVTTAANKWTRTAQANNGFLIENSSGQDADTSGYRSFWSANHNGGSPTLSINYDQAPGVIGSNISPLDTADNNVTSGAPTLYAYPTDADDASVNLQWEVDDTNGNAVWTTTTTGQPTNAWDQVVVGSGLTEHGTYSWQVLAVDSSGVSTSWFGYPSTQSFTVESAAPPAPTLTSDENIPLGSWVAPDTGTGAGATLSQADFSAAANPAPNTDAPAVGVRFNWNGQGWGTFQAPDSNGYAHLRETNLAGGPYTVQAQTEDSVGNVGPVASFGFGIGLAVVGANHTWRNLLLTPAGTSDKTSVTYAWRPFAGSATGGWQTLPTGDVTNSSTGAGISAWPVADTSPGVFPKLVWNAYNTTTGGGANPAAFTGVIQVQATYNGAQQAVQAVHLDKSPFGSNYAEQNVGPGTVSLATGDLDVSATDVSLPGYKDALTFGRDFTTLHPNNGLAPATQVLGPGWTAALPGPDEGASTDVVTDNSNTSGYLQLTDSDGSTMEYLLNGQPGESCTQTACQYVGVAETAYDGSTLTKTTSGATSTISLTDSTGVITSWTSQGGSFVVSQVSDPSTHSNYTYSYNANGTLAYVIAPAPDGISCVPNGAGDITAAGCRELTFSYAAAGTAAPGDTTNTWGPFASQLTSVSYWSADPQNSNAVSGVPVAQYAYDSHGHLRSEWDPRLASPLKTGYDYLSTAATSPLLDATPPGLTTQTLGYDSLGRLTTVSVAQPAAPEGSGNTAVTSVVYGVPVSGTGAPLPLTPATMTTWGQVSTTNASNQPSTATEVFRADETAHTPSGSSADPTYGTITYINNDARPTNVAVYGGPKTLSLDGSCSTSTATSWQLSVRLYDQFSGDVTEAITPKNLESALCPGIVPPPHGVALNNDTLTRVGLVASTNTYSTDWTDLLTTVGPTANVVATNGRAALAGRRVTTNTWDTGSDPGEPAGGRRHLLTKTVTSIASLGYTGNGSDNTSRTTSYGYAPIEAGDTNGWVLRQPTMSTVSMNGNGADLVTVTRYDPDGRTLETRMPRDTPAGGTPAATTPNDAGTNVTAYYAHSSPVAGCSNDAYAGWVCQTGPANAVATVTGPAGSQPKLLVHAITAYNRWGQATTANDTSGTTVRTTTSTFDPAGRVLMSVTSSTESSPAIPSQNTSYAASTGFITCVSTATGCSGNTVSTGYDSLGRVDSQTDAEGDTTTTSYDVDGRAVNTTEAKSSANYSSTTHYFYDGATSAGSSTDALGNPERRGMLTAVDNGLSGTSSLFTGAYDQNGNLSTQVYPNDHTSGTNTDAGTGTVSHLTYDPTDYLTQKSYDFTSSCRRCWHFNSQPNGFGQSTWQSDNNDGPTTTYDAAGRLQYVYDNVPGGATTHLFTRNYTYDSDSNRTAATTTNTSYAALVNADAPSASWHLDDTSGTTASDSVGSTNGTYPSAANTLGVTGTTPGQTDRGVSFTGNAAFTTAKTSAVTLNGSWTIAFWIKGAAPSGYPNLIHKSAASKAGDGWKITAFPDGQLQLTRDGNNVLTGTALDGTWHQVYFTYNGTTLTAGQDGKVMATTSCALTADTSTSGLTVGEGAPFTLDELAIYQKALTPDRLQYQYQAAAYGSYNQTGHTYDDADRLTDPGTTYDAYGRTTTVPSSDAGGIGTISSGTQGNLTATYYQNDLAASLTAGGVTTSYSLDPLRRLDSTTVSSVSGTRTLQHYAQGAAGGSEAASWVETQNTPAGSTSGWTRNLTALDGYGGSTTSSGNTSLAFTNLHGDIAGTGTPSAGYATTGITDYTEFGGPDPTTPATSSNSTGPNQYGWLGVHRRDQNAPAGITLMGERLYSATLGRFLSPDPVPGGSANDYDYANQDPSNQNDLAGTDPHPQPYLVINHYSIKGGGRTTLRIGVEKKRGAYGLTHITQKHSDLPIRAVGVVLSNFTSRNVQDSGNVQYRLTFGRTEQECGILLCHRKVIDTVSVLVVVDRDPEIGIRTAYCERPGGCPSWLPLALNHALN